MTRLTQQQINDAYVDLLAGDDTQWRVIVDAVRAGTVAASMTSTTLSIRAMPVDTGLADMLGRLRRDAGQPTLAEIADAVSVSPATVSRLLAGRGAGSWPLVKVIVEYLGGRPETFYPVWQAARRRS